MNIFRRYCCLFFLLLLNWKEFDVCTFVPTIYLYSTYVRTYVILYNPILIALQETKLSSPPPSFLCLPVARYAMSLLGMEWMNRIISMVTEYTVNKWGIWQANHQDFQEVFYFPLLDYSILHSNHTFCAVVCFEQNSRNFGFAIQWHANIYLNVTQEFCILVQVD